MEKSEASGAEDENEKTMREDKERNERKGVSLSPPAALETGTGVAAAKKKPRRKEEEEEEENVSVSEKTIPAEKRKEDAEGKEEKKTIESILEALKTELHRFFRELQKAASRASTTASVAWRRFARDARRRFRDLRRRAKALKDGLSTEDKNVLRAAGVLVGAILAVNVSNAIVGGRSRAPFE